MATRDGMIKTPLRDNKVDKRKVLFSSPDADDIEHVSKVNRTVSDSDASLKEVLLDAMHCTKVETFAFIESKTDNLHNLFTKLEIENKTLDVELKKVQKENKDLKDFCQNELQQIKIQANDLAQHGRRNSIRLYGLPELDNENTRRYVHSVIQEVLNDYSFPISEISVAHRLPIPNTSNRAERGIIIVFTTRESRNIVYNRRKEFYNPVRNFYLRISEDLTPENTKLLWKGKQHPDIKDTWSMNGLIKAETNDGQKIRLYPFLDLDQQIPAQRPGRARPVRKNVPVHHRKAADQNKGPVRNYVPPPPPPPKESVNQNKGPVQNNVPPPPKEPMDQNKGPVRNDVSASQKESVVQNKGPVRNNVSSPPKEPMDKKKGPVRNNVPVPQKESMDQNKRAVEVPITSERVTSSVEVHLSPPSVTPQLSFRENLDMDIDRPPFCQSSEVTLEWMKGHEKLHFPGAANGEGE